MLIENINIAGTNKIPFVNFDYEKGIIELKGRSTPEDSDSVFQPLLNWILNYIDTPQEVTTLNINFEYYNSSTAKYLSRIFEQIIKLVDQDKKLIVNWYYYDLESKEDGEDFAEILEYDFNFISAEFE